MGAGCVPWSEALQWSNCARILLAALQSKNSDQMEEWQGLEDTLSPRENLMEKILGSAAGMVTKNKRKNSFYKLFKEHKRAEIK